MELENEKQEVKKYDIPAAIQTILNSKKKIVLAVTGGGAGCIDQMLRYGGGSDILLEAIVPYNKHSLAGFIKKEPEKYASLSTAKQMAMSAYQRALHLNSKEGIIKPEYLLGIGVTSKLIKVSDERGGREHRIHFACQSYDRTFVSSVTVNSSLNRPEQEEFAADFIVEKIALNCSPDIQTDKKPDSMNIFEDADEREERVEKDVADLLTETLKDMNSRALPVPSKISMGLKNGKSGIVFSGSFNPFHKNHMLMAKIAYETYKKPVCFEISLANVDKPPIDYISLKERIDSLLEYGDREWMGDIYLSNAALFADKAILFPDSVFLIGSDTFNRLFNEKYYRENENMQSLLGHFKKYNVRFSVFRRKDSDMDTEIPGICEMVPVNTYSDDGTSSTKIRGLRQK